MTVLLGLWFSLAIGVSDYFGGYVTRRSHAFATVANAAMAGTVVEWLVEDGDPVSPGQPLVRLHPEGSVA